MSNIMEALIREAKRCEELPEFHDRSVEDILVHIKFNDGHIHSIYPNNKIARELTIGAIEDLQIETKKEKIELPKRIIFRNRQAIGDILMMTCSIRDFKKAFPDIQIKVESTAMHIWDYNPNLCRDKWNDIIDAKEDTEQAIKQAVAENKPVRIYIGPSKGTNSSNRSDKHFANAYRMSIEDILNVKIPQGAIRPDIHMSEDEYKKAPIIKPPYWLITAGEKGDWTCKTYCFDKWQEVVDRLPDIKFVQIGSSGHKHQKLKGKNVIDFIGKTQDSKTGIRDLFNLFLNCEGSLGLVSFQMHLAAAFNKPCIVMAGAREPVSFTRYPGQRYLSTDGCLPCTIKNNDEPTACWFCDIDRCKYKDKRPNSDVLLPRCVDLFSCWDIIKEVERYYDGGRLSLKKPLGKSKLINIVKGKDIIDVKKDNVKKSGYELEFGGGSITGKDWDFIQNTIKKYKIKTVLEFGAGLSTLSIKNKVDELTTYETNQSWIDKIKSLNKDCRIKKWDGINFPDKFSDKFDLVFVDGPAGGENREASTKKASELGKLVIVHDAGRVPEKKWQDKYLKEEFELVEKGGHRCHLWMRSNTQFKTIENKDVKSIKETNRALKTNEKQRIIKVLFNGRGEGGAERSTTWIMNKFIELGWRVQYFSPNINSSGTFRKEGNKKIEFINDINKIKGDCDILFLYANDWVWNFKTPEVGNIINSINANRKVMAINFRMGDIGTQKAPWTLGWDKYICLNSSLENTLINRTKVNAVILPPPTNLSEYHENKSGYGGNLKLIRHSSQGDAKYPKNFNGIIERVLFEIPDCEIFLMPAPSFLSDKFKRGDRVHSFKRNAPEVKEFLKYGNCFWYSLPDGYHDQGPKVIMEAQASGLPVIADNHSGAKDRVICGGTGFLCDNLDQHILAMKKLNNEKRREQMGTHAKLHAEKTYDPNNWIKEISG